MTRTLLIIIGAIIVLGGVFVGYKYMFIDTASQNLTVTDTSSADGANLPGEEIIAQLNRLPQDLDGTIFSDPSYLKLVDGTVQLPDLPVGRNNPFAPIFTASRTGR